jgi:tRNA G18 (ribose-2'-O)-methylase SpoU
MDYTDTSDTRNVIDEFKGLPHEQIVEALDLRGVELEIAVENTLRDYNMGTIVRCANAFGVRTVHVIGRKQWNKRGAMATDKYLTVIYYASVGDFVLEMKKRSKQLIAVDITKTSQPLADAKLPKNAVLIFGQEGPGLSDEILEVANAVTHIEQVGSTRSINVGVAAGIVMYEWVRRNH